jgi:hypothetical protein
MVCYMKDFGEQGYFLDFPSKFISPDGRSLWLCYSANFSPGWNGVKLAVNPPEGRYGLCLLEVKLLTTEAANKMRRGARVVAPPGGRDLCMLATPPYALRWISPVRATAVG